MGRVEAARAGRIVLVHDADAPASGGGVMQAWSQREWAELLAAIRETDSSYDVIHPGVDYVGSDQVELGLQRMEPLTLRLADWWALFDSVKFGKFDFDKLSSPAATEGVGAGAAGPDGTGRPSEAATGAGAAGNPPAPVAAMNVPAGQLSCAPALDPPQGAGQPGLDFFSADQVEVDYLAEVIAEAHAQGFGGYRLARYILAVGYRRDVVPPAVVESWRDAAAAALKWGSGPLVEHVIEASRGGGTAEATGGAPPDRVGVSGGKAGPGLTPRGSGPAEPENPCPYTQAHTRHWCGYAQCRDS